MDKPLVKLNTFKSATTDEVCKLIKQSSTATCDLDPIPSKLIHTHASAPSITKIINKILSSSEFPSSMKNALVKPLLKKPNLDQNVLKNYRPISNLSFLSKLVEKVISTRLFEHMKTNGLLEKMQSAYKVGHSTETAILRIQNDLLCSVDKGCGVYLILLDLSAAFDTVDHSLLLSLFENILGIEDAALHLLKSYLTGRSQCVVIENLQSELTDLIYGVPQGSVLGPIKFCMYTLPLGSILRFHKIDYHIYADDTQVYLAFNYNDPDPSLNRLSNAICDVRSWMIHNRLKINDDKTEFIVITPQHRQKISHHKTLEIGSHLISSSKAAKNLGVIFDSALNMDKHISHICQSTMFHLRNIGAIRHLLSVDASAQLVHSLVTSHLDYCNSALYGLPDTQINRLQRIQNIAARIVTRSQKTCHITPVLQSLHWLPVRYRLLYKILLFAYKVHNKSAPSYLCDLLKPHTQSRSLRSNNQLLFSVQKSRLKTYGDRAFSIAAPKEWNKLPTDLKQSPSLSCVKSNIKTYLFKLCFNLIK